MTWTLAGTLSRASSEPGTGEVPMTSMVGSTRVDDWPKASPGNSANAKPGHTLFIAASRRDRRSAGSIARYRTEPADRPEPARIGQPGTALKRHCSRRSGILFPGRQGAVAYDSGAASALHLLLEAARLHVIQWSGQRTAAQRVNPPARWRVGVQGLLFARSTLPGPPPHPSPPLRGGREEFAARPCARQDATATAVNPGRMRLACLHVPSRRGKARVLHRRIMDNHMRSPSRSRAVARPRAEGFSTTERQSSSSIPQPSFFPLNR